MQSFLNTWLWRKNIHPRRWVKSFFTYRKYMGYIRPQLIKESENEYKIRRKILNACWEPQRLKIPVGKRILAISPHADDETIGAGGLLLAHRNISDIHLVLLTNGEKGGAVKESISDVQEYRLQLIEERRKEYLRTAEYLNATTHFLDYQDGNIPCTTEAALRIRKIIEHVKPDVVLLPWLFDNLEDHRRANLLYALGCADFELIILAYEIWSMLDANAILDITDYIDDKISMIKNYVSQLRTVDYLNYTIALSRVRAFSHPVRERREGAVEAFLALPNAEYCELVHNYFNITGIEIK